MTPSLLTAIGFKPGEQHQLLAFCEQHEMTPEQLLRYAVAHYFDACDIVAVPPANFEGQAPSFAKEASVFAAKAGEEP
jgi:hypothetical protein